MSASFKNTSKNQHISTAKLNRRAGSGHVDVSAAAGEYSKLSAKGGSQLYPSQHSAVGAHSASMTQPPHDSSSFTTSAHAGMPPTQATGAPSHQQMAYQSQGQQPTSSIDQQHQQLPSQQEYHPSQHQQQFASYEPNSLL